MDIKAFIKASERAELCVRQIEQARTWLDDGGDALIAVGFNQQPEFEGDPHRRDPVLEEFDGQLAAVADRVVHHE